MNVVVLDNQSFFDIALRYTGSVSMAIAIAKSNGYNVTDSLMPGTIIAIPDGLTVDAKVVEYYSVKNINPSTAYTIDSKKELMRVFDVELPEQFS